MKLKYIMVDELFPVLFPDAITHKHAALGLKVTSAGFCDIDKFNGEWEVDVWGKSVSLGDLKSKPEDAIWIKKMLDAY